MQEMTSSDSGHNVEYPVIEDALDTETGTISFREKTDIINNLLETGYPAPGLINGLTEKPILKTYPINPCLLI